MTIRPALLITLVAVISAPAAVSAGTIRELRELDLWSQAFRVSSKATPASLPSPQLPERYKRMLSSGGYIALYGAWRQHAAEVRARIAAFPQTAPPSPSVNLQVSTLELAPPAQPGALLSAPPRPAGAIKQVPTVNNKSLDTRTDANTQSEPSIAVFRNNVVIGYNSSANFVGGSGFTGYSYSANAGKTFTEVPGGLSPIGTILPMGDPSLAVDDTGIFYFATIALDTSNSDSYVLIYRSTDGGVTFTNFVSVLAACTTAPDCDFLDKELIAIDTNPLSAFKGRLYVTFTNFLAGGAGTEIHACAFDTVTVSLVGCTLITSEDAHGSMPAVGPNGELYVAWEQTSNTGSPTGYAIYGAKSLDGGATFPLSGKLSDVWPVFDADVSANVCGQQALRGGIRVHDFPVIAVDTGARSRFRGNIYITWNDMRSGDADILGMASSDGGATWQGPGVINTKGAGTDQFMPWVTVLPNGRIAGIWYDRRNDPSNNWWIDVFMGVSANAGATTSNTALTKTPFPVIVNVDFEVNDCYMGDYNQITNDGTRFFMAWGDNHNGNPDVVFLKR